MFKRTPGKWGWTIASKGSDLKIIIIVKDENEDNGTFDFAGEPLKPTVGDFQLTTNSPEMHELIHEVIDELDEAFSQGVLTEGLYKIRRKASALLEEINVERTNPPCK